MFNIFGLTFHIYGLLIGVAIVLALAMSKKIAKKRGVDVEIVDQVAWGTIIGGILGSRIYHIIEYWQAYYSHDLFRVLYVWNGGLGIWGGVFGGMIGTLIAYRFGVKTAIRTKLPFIRLTDLLIVGLPLAQAIGRAGNFLNQEVYGNVTSLPWGIFIDSDRKYHHPLFAYEAGLNVVLFAILWMASIKSKTEGAVTGLYFIGYGIIRLALEPLRPNGTTWIIGNIPTASLISGVSILVGVIFIYCRQKRS